MKLGQIVGAAAIIATCVMVAVPVLIRAVHALLIPAVVGVVLYLVVRIVNAYLNRW
jgi:hypothetical protein